jgi:hypothetical protein
MKIIGFCSLFSLAVFLGSISASAQESPVDILIITKSERDKEGITTKSEGSGTETIRTQYFKAKITNASLDPVKNLEVKLFVVAGENVWKGREKEYGVIKVLGQGGIDLGVPGDAEVDFGEVEFKTTYTETASAIWKGGLLYEGYVAEFWTGDKMIGTKVFGGKEVKKAYEVYVKKKKD